MKKKTVWNRMLSLVMALAICLSLPMTVFAEELSGTVDVETTAGNTEAVDVTITIEKDSCTIEMILYTDGMALETLIVISEIGKMDVKLPDVD